MLGVTVNQAKGLFFDSPAVERATTRAERDKLRRFGGAVRKRARFSMRRRKGVSQAGQPPNAHVGLLRDKLFFVYERERRSVVIGPALLGDRRSKLKPVAQTVPEILEEGGPARLKSETLFIEPRPFMLPAFEAELPNAAPLWRDSVKG